MGRVTILNIAIREGLSKLTCEQSEKNSSTGNSYDKGSRMGACQCSPETGRRPVWLTSN